MPPLSTFRREGWESCEASNIKEDASGRSTEQSGQVCVKNANREEAV